ncbi:hypothetical protein [Peribacillus kribbensis]|jgi:hypothetical protein|uniref:hypothetical protein n=1 Tax=Peribacillus kribbensis TaxID=356658 RepID=UPI00041C7DD3|nr:hypothetical protein [Peribacillus kribbensis]
MTKGQDDLKQYRMPELLREKKNFHYRVGYTATTGNRTGNGPEPSKRSDLEH